MTKQPFSKFALPRQHLAEGDYTPPPRRKDSDIARLRGLPPGTLLLEEQQKGIETAGKMLTLVHTEEDRAYVARMIAITATNSCWYTYVQNADTVMNRFQDLPKIADHITDERQTEEGLLQQLEYGLDSALQIARAVTAQHTANQLRKRTVRTCGRHIGNLGLLAAAVQHNATRIGGDAFTVQKEMREIGLVTLEDSRTFVKEAGAHPSFAQFADAHGPLITHMYNNAPNGVVTSFERATAS